MNKDEFLKKEFRAFVNLQQQIQRGMKVGVNIFLKTWNIGVVTLEEGTTNAKAVDYNYCVNTVDLLKEMIDNRILERKIQWQDAFGALIHNVEITHFDHYFGSDCFILINVANKDEIYFDYTRDGWQACADFLSTSRLMSDVELERCRLGNWKDVLREYAMHKIATREHDNVCRDVSSPGHAAHLTNTYDSVLVEHAAKREQQKTPHIALDAIMERLLQAEMTKIIAEELTQ